MLGLSSPANSLIPSLTAVCSPWTCQKRVLNGHSFARRKADEEDVYDFQDVTSGEKSRSRKEGRGRGRGKGEVSSSSPSQSSLDDIPRPSELGLSIEEQAKLMHAYRIQVSSLPPYRPPQPLSQIPPLPAEVLTFILSLIPRTPVPALTLLSHDFLSAAQTVLYSNLDMRDVWNPDAVWIFLTTSLTHVLYVPAWPFAQTSAYLIPCVLSRMDNLRFITLPSFDLHIVCHHSAFELRHIEFRNTSLRAGRN
ncbi:hypothetical protein ARMGADRAFT_78726 [Armillaria gallica]|uniref:F-box domain-containing protein n=1 Tax=Armillaria gallica TaxID=47427 RepID=A0A2H3CPM6_ARMGA|nr:hypothetical protein ARMGADRAFT_78726 [Armillaria gallica]